MLRSHLLLRSVQITIIILSCLESVLVVEVILRHFSFQYFKNKYYLWPPLLSRIVTPVAGQFPGIWGEKRFFINSLGFRGPEIKNNQTIRVLAIGGSTTECSMLDESETWPYLLNERLKQNYGNMIWVGNAGRRGSTLRDNLLHMQYVVPQVGKIQTIIMLVGVNDFMYHLTPQGRKDLNNPKSMIRADLVSHAFFIHPYVDYGFRGSAIWNLLKRAKISFLGRKLILEPDGKTQLDLAKKREETQKLNYLPDITLGLSYYKTQLQKLVEISKENKVQLVFMTQPSLWKSSMPEFEEKLLWFGCVDETNGTVCYSGDSLANGLHAYNEVLLEVCADSKLSCLDLESELPKDTAVFYDDVHFNPSGTQQVAEKAAKFLIDNKILEPV